MFKSLIKRIANAFTKAGVAYMIIGGQALLFYGEPRMTKDIDITIGHGAGEVKKVKEIVEQLPLKVLVEDAEAFVKKTMVLPLIEEKTGIRVDIIFSFSEYEKQAIKRATEFELDDTIVRYASLEDVIIQKTVAGRARDIEDVRTMILKNPDYDRDHVLKWLKEFDVSLGKDFSKVFKKIVDEIDK